jgi:RNA polymerase sigma factor (sigma-70 family)
LRFIELGRRFRTLIRVEGIIAAGDTDLVAQALAGDPLAFAQLVQPHLASALSGARLIIGDSGDAADAVQELLSAWRGLPSLRDRSAFGPWFRQHVIRSARRTAKRVRRSVRFGEGWLDPVDHLERDLAARHLKRTFARLDADDRVLLTLRYHYGLANEETAQLLKVPTGTVKSRVHYALRRLRAADDAEERA